MRTPFRFLGGRSTHFDRLFLMNLNMRWMCIASILRPHLYLINQDTRHRIPICHTAGPQIGRQQLLSIPNPVGFEHSHSRCKRAQFIR